MGKNFDEEMWGVLTAAGVPPLPKGKNFDEEMWDDLTAARVSPLPKRQECRHYHFAVQNVFRNFAFRHRARPFRYKKRSPKEQANGAE